MLVQRTCFHIVWLYDWATSRVIEMYSSMTSCPNSSTQHEMLIYAGPICLCLTNIFLMMCLSKCLYTVLLYLPQQHLLTSRFIYPPHCVEKHSKEFLGGSELAPISATALPPTEIQQCECSNVAQYLRESTVPSWFIVYPSSYKAKCLVCLSEPLYIYVDLFICTYTSPGKATSPHYCNGSGVGTTSPSQEMFIEVGLGYHSLTR